MTRSRWGWGWCAATAVLVAGCSASVDPTAQPGSDPFSTPIDHGTASATTEQPQSWSGSAPRTGSGTVTLLIPTGERLPDSVADDFHRTTGFSLTQVEVPLDQLASGGPEGTRADVVLGLDATDALAATSAGVLTDGVPEDTTTADGTALQSAPGAVAVGRDDICVMADMQWFAANNLTAPTSFAELASDTFAKLLEIPDPTTTVEGRSFVQASATAEGEGAAAWWTDLIGRGAEVAASDSAVSAWTATSTTGTRPLLVTRAMTAATTLDNTGAQSISAAVGSTCLDREIFAAATVDPANADGAESLLAYLTGSVAQQGLADAAIVMPMDASAADDTPVAWFATPSDQAVSVSESDLARTTDWLSAWSTAIAPM